MSVRVISGNSAFNFYIERSKSAPRLLKNFMLSTKFQLLIKTKIHTNEEVSCCSLSDVVFFMLINVKMPTIVGILIFMSRIHFMLS